MLRSRGDVVVVISLEDVDPRLVEELGDVSSKGVVVVSVDEVADNSTDGVVVIFGSEFDVEDSLDVVLVVVSVDRSLVMLYELLSDAADMYPSVVLRSLVQPDW